MGRLSKSPSPLAQLRRLLNPQPTASNFAKRHRIKFDRYKKIESLRAKEELYAHEAEEIGAAYGIFPESLCKSSSYPIAIDNEKATPIGIIAWQNTMADENAAKAMGREAMRQIYSMFLAANACENALKFAQKFESWKRVVFESMGTQFKNSFHEFYSRPRVAERGLRSFSELDEMLGEDRGSYEWRERRKNLKRGKRYSIVKTRENQCVPLIEFEPSAEHMKVTFAKRSFREITKVKFDKKVESFFGRIELSSFYGQVQEFHDDEVNLPRRKKMKVKVIDRISGIKV